MFVFRKICFVFLVTSVLKFSLLSYYEHENSLNLLMKEFNLEKLWKNMRKKIFSNIGHGLACLSGKDHLTVK